MIRHKLPLCSGKVALVVNGRHVYSVVDDHQLSVAVLQCFSFSVRPV